MPFEQQHRQRILQDGSYNAQMQNPQLRAIMDKMSQVMFSKPLSELGESERNMFLIAGGAINNSFMSDMLGLDNGAKQWETLHRAVAASPISLGIMNSAGVRGAGFSYGTGSVSAGVTNQLMRAVNNAAYTANGSINEINTRGLTGDQYAQVYGGVVKQMGLSTADIKGVDLSGNSEELKKTIVRLAESGQVDGEQMVQFRKLLKARRAFEKHRESATSDNDALAAMQASGEFDAEMMKDMYLQVGGNLRGFTIDKKFTDKVKDATREVAGNIKHLSELTGYKELEDLEAVAKTLGLGSITAKNNITQVERRMREWKTIAQTQNRDIREVMKESADITEAVAASVGGREFVPTAMVSQIQNARASGQAAFESGHSLYTGEEVGAREHQNASALREHYGGTAVMEELLRSKGQTMDPRDKKKLEAYLKQARDAAEAGDSDALYEAALAGEAFASGIYNPTRDPARDAAFKRRALANSSTNYVELARRTNLNDNIDALVADHASVERHGIQGTQELNIFRELEGKPGLDPNAKGEDGMREFIRARQLTFGSNYEAADAYNARVRKIVGMNAKDREKAWKEFRAELKSQGYTDEQMQQFDIMNSAYENIANFSFGDKSERLRKVDAIIDFGNTTMDDSTGRFGGDGFVMKREMEKKMLANLMGDIARRSDGYQKGSGMQALIAGILGSNKVSQMDTMLAMHERSGYSSIEELAKSNGGAVLGTMKDGKLQLGPGGMKKLLDNNENLRKMLGVERAEEYLRTQGSEEAAMDHMLSTLHSKESLGEIGGKLTVMDGSRVANFQSKMEKALSTDAAKDLASLYGEKRLKIDDEGKAYVMGSDGKRHYKAEDKDAVIDMLMNPDEKNQDMRENIIRQANKGAKRAREILALWTGKLLQQYHDSDDRFDELDGSEESEAAALWRGDKERGFKQVRTIGEAREVMKKLYGTSNVADLLSEEAARKAGLIDEDGDWTGGLYAKDGESAKDTLQDLSEQRDMLMAISAADAVHARGDGDGASPEAGGSSSTGADEIIGYLKEAFSTGIPVILK